MKRLEVQIFEKDKNVVEIRIKYNKFGWNIGGQR